MSPKKKYHLEMSFMFMGILGLTFVIALSMGAFSKDTKDKGEVWSLALKISLGMLVVGLLLYGIN